MSESSTTLVIVEDNPADMTQYMRLLEDAQHKFDHIECFSTIEHAAECLENTNTTSCCLLDYSLPDGSALSLIKTLKSKGGDLGCPIVVITGQNDTKSAVNLLKLGVQDYLTKDELSSGTLMRTIESAMKNWSLKRQLEHMAMYDSLTNTANRGLLVEKLEQMLNEAIRYNHECTLIMLDLDNFKIVNDIYGHEAGDYVLRTVGNLLNSNLREVDIAGRLGGDEFAILLPETAGDSATVVAEKIASILSFDIEWKNSIIPISCSLGVANYPSRAKNATELMREADIALYKCKQDRTKTVEYYRRSWSETGSEKENLRNYLPLALKNNDLKLALQPIFKTQNEDTVLFAVEVLTRLSFDGKWVNPITIINMVMELGLDIEFHRWLFSSAFSHLKNMQRGYPDVKMSINLPANICHSPRIRNLLVEMSKKSEVNPKNIILEVTETHLMTEPDKAKECMNYLVDHGFSFAIDDFGTGYSSMEYIAELPCSYLKIDKKFFLNLKSNQRNQNIIEAITALSHGLEMNVIAEGIETEELVSDAIQMQCDYLQGFYFSQPVILENENLCELLSEWQGYQIPSNNFSGLLS